MRGGAMALSPICAAGSAGCIKCISVDRGHTLAFIFISELFISIYARARARENPDQNILNIVYDAENDNL